MGQEFNIGPGPDDPFRGGGAVRFGPAAFLGHARRRWFNSLPFHCFLFLLTLLTTLVVGAHIALNYGQGLPAFDWDLSLTFFTGILRSPATLALGVPFSCTLLAILLAHEMGHYFACRYYGIESTYPYFIPAPTLIGTMGAFIRIRSPIPTRRALFDVGISGPLAGFAVALPALVVATLHSQGVAPLNSPGSIKLGNPLAIILLTKILHPSFSPSGVALQPIGCGAWVGLFATALNLLPIGQLDGGHILYAVLGERHRAISRGLVLALVPLGVFCWPGWVVWAAMLLVVGLRHPLVMYPLEPLDKTRKVLAVFAALLFLLTFIPTPFSVR
jgi:membrane-associated protease RseP (regulator of RpoE activity)